MFDGELPRGNDFTPDELPRCIDFMPEELPRCIDFMPEELPRLKEPLEEGGALLRPAEEPPRFAPPAPRPFPPFCPRAMEGSNTVAKQKTMIATIGKNAIFSCCIDLGSPCFDSELARWIGDSRYGCFANSNWMQPACHIMTLYRSRPARHFRLSICLVPFSHWACNRQFNFVFNVSINVSKRQQKIAGKIPPYVRRLNCINSLTANTVKAYEIRSIGEL